MNEQEQLAKNKANLLAQQEQMAIEHRSEYGQIAYILAEYVRLVCKEKVLNPPEQVREALIKMDLARGIGGYKHPIQGYPER